VRDPLWAPRTLAAAARERPSHAASQLAGAKDAFRRWQEAMGAWERDRHSDPRGLTRGEPAVRGQDMRLDRLNTEWMAAVERCGRPLAGSSG
jgi:hypothetical protein